MPLIVRPAKLGVEGDVVDMKSLLYPCRGQLRLAKVHRQSESNVGLRRVTVEVQRTRWGSRRKAGP